MTTSERNQSIAVKYAKRIKQINRTTVQFLIKLLEVIISNDADLIENKYD